MGGSRVAPFTGILFAALYVAAWFVSRTPDTDDPASAVAEYYADSGNRVMMVVAAYLLVVAGFVFLLFLASVRTRLLAAEGGDAPLTTVAFASGSIAVALLLAGTFALAAVPAGIVFGGVDTPTNGDIVTFTQQIAYGMILVGSMIAAAVAIFTASLVIRRTKALPAWTAWLSFVAALALLFAAFWIPQIALPIWTIAIGLALRKPAPGSPQVEGSTQQPA